MTNKKKVLFIIPYLGTGGAERQSVTVARLLADKGYLVSFLTYAKGDLYRDLLESSGVSYHNIEKRGFHRLFDVTRFIYAGEYNVVISFMQTPNFLNNFAALFGKKWTVITSIRATPPKTEFQSLKGRIYGWFYRKSDYIVTNSFHTKDVFITLFPKYRAKLATIYNAVKLGSIHTEYHAKHNNCLSVIIAATVSDVKNPLGLIAALELMSESERDLLHIDWYGKKESVLGNSSTYSTVLEEIENKRLQSVFTWHDATNDIASLMNKADCVALFSKLEGLPNAICEGMMLGKPIIMTRCSDYELLIKENINGFLCNWDDPMSIKNALIKMAKKNVEQLMEMGRESKIIAEKMFSEEAISQAWANLIEH